MHKIVVILICIVSSALAYADWDQQVFTVEASLTQNSTQFQQQDLYTTNALADVSIIKMFEGYALRLDSKLKNSQLYQTQLDQSSADHNYSSYEFQFASRFFLGPVANFDVQVGKQSDYANSEFNLVRFLPNYSAITKKDEAVATLNWHIGSADGSRTLDLAFDAVKNEYEFIKELGPYKTNTANKLSAEFSDQVSEDTHWQLTYIVLDSTNQFVDVEQEQNVNNVLAGFSTSYMGNSQLRVLIGNSHQENKDIENEADSFSWVVENTLSISEDLEFVMASERQFNSSPDPRFSGSLVSDFTSALHWKYSENIQLQTEIEYKHYDFYEDRFADMWRIAQVATWRPLNQFVISIGMEYQQYDGSRSAFIHEGVNVNAQVTWEVWQ